MGKLFADILQVVYAAGLMRRRIAITLALAAAAVLLVSASSASAAITHRSYTYGPITISPYQVKQSEFDFRDPAPHPAEDGFVTHMDVDVVDPKTGQQVPISRIMLHHIVFSALGRPDGTCNQFTLLDSRTQVPAASAERFYAAGEERAELDLPPGYGYRVKGSDPWLLTWMMMNHRNVKDTVVIKYNITYDTNPALKAVKPLWLDVKNCLADPIYNVPGGGRPGSTHVKRSDWKAPEAGRLVAGGGHVHGGAKDLVLSQPECRDRKLFTSKPTWGLPSHPFYRVRPKLHEPGPINMSGFNSAKGIPVAKGQTLRLSSRYDNQRAHMRAMGIMVVYFAPDASVTDRCAPLPGDLQVSRSAVRGRSRAPRYTVPLYALDRNGEVVEVKRPPGRRHRLGGDGSVQVGDLFFKERNLSIRRGANVTWTFGGSTLHNVTLANGPRGFASVNLSDGRQFRERFRKAGTYRIFCALHPVAMTQEIVVRR